MPKSQCPRMGALQDSPASLQRGAWRWDCLVLPLTGWEPKFPRSPLFGGAGFERQKAAACTFVIRGLCHSCRAPVGRG